MKKVIPFIKAKPEPKQIVPLQSNGSKNTPDGRILDHGKLGDLNYEVYARGVIHIFDQTNLRFKKDINLFDNEVREKDFDKLNDDAFYLIQGSGDNDDLLFTKKNGEIVVSLKKKDFEVIQLLKSILKKGKDAVRRG